MLGLPSTTEVGKRIPKEAFYRNLKINAKTRDEFVHEIERIEIANSIKPTTANIADGEKVHEILVLRMDLKGEVLPERAILAIAKANPHKLVFCIEPAEETFVVHEEHLESNTIETLELVGETMDAVWDSVLAQVVLGTTYGEDAGRRIKLKRQRATIEYELVTLDAKMRKEKQIAKKNKLFDQIKAKKKELEQLEEGE